jgi:hypothetical protein
VAGAAGTAGHATPQSGGFHLAPGDEATFDVPHGWSCLVWPRRGCSFDVRGLGTCATGDCGGVFRCSGWAGATPATVVEMTLGTPRSICDRSVEAGGEREKDREREGGREQIEGGDHL